VTRENRIAAAIDRVMTVLLLAVAIATVIGCHVLVLMKAR
jgi:hypothetical protein